VRRYVEIAPHADLDRALDALAPGDGVKVRGAGPVRYSIPGVDWLARVLVECDARHLVLKVGGGLDHPYRSTGEGAARHGFVNLLAAAGVARSRGGVDAVARTLATQEDGAADLLRQVSGARELVASISVSSLDRPLRELAARDML
jgi:hypothetical protein